MQYLGYAATTYKNEISAGGNFDGQSMAFYQDSDNCKMYQCSISLAAN
jgi:hypothetical protein